MRHGGSPNDDGDQWKAELGQKWSTLARYRVKIDDGARDEYEDDARGPLDVLLGHLVHACRACTCEHTDARRVACPSAAHELDAVHGKRAWWRIHSVCGRPRNPRGYPYAGEVWTCHVDATAQTRARTGAESATSLVCSNFVSPVSKIPNFKTSQLSWKSPKIKVVEEL
jgi:hypothetical protein